ncbi:MAG: PKD domain-containing protein [Bacteroidota bacterium]|nr:PKD domain-containing protein [Bacteroidota bacterium]
MKIIKSRCFLIILFFHIYILSAFSISASFTFIQQGKCAPAVVKFVNKSTKGNGIKYTWNFGTGTDVINDRDTVEHTFTSAGRYTVKLTVSDGTSQKDTSVVLTFFQGPTANFTTQDTSFYCASKSHLVNLKNNSKNAVGYAWYASNKLFSSLGKDTSYVIDITSKTYEQLYNHDINKVKVPIKLVVTDSIGCQDSITKEVVVLLPVARFMPDKVSGCAPLLVSFADSSKSPYTIDKRIYKLGADTIPPLDSTLVRYNFKNPGEYYISEIISSNGCTDTSRTIKVVVGEKLIPDFQVDSTVCNEGKIHIKSWSNKDSFVNIWHFRSPNLFDYSFTSKPDTSVTIYSDTTGVKNVSLEIGYNGCFSDTTKKAIFKIKGPAGNFLQSFSCDSSMVYHFKSNIKPADSLFWNVDTASFKNVDTLKYTFPKSGDYKVKLMAKEYSSGCSLTRTHVVKVRGIKANYTIKDTILCVGDSAKLDASTSKDYINTCYNEGFLWDFGDGSQTRRTYLTTYNHIYNKKGKYKLLLTAVADNGCIDSTKRYVYVFKPSASFSPDTTTGCVDTLKVKFTSTSTDSTVVKWIWDFKDGIKDTLTNSNPFSHYFTSTVDTVFQPTLMVYDIHKCKASYSLPDITLRGINCDFTADKTGVCPGATVTFTPVDPVTNLYWNFGNGNSSQNNNSNLYSKTGKYTVSLTASENGCRKTVTKKNYINVTTPVASISGDTVMCKGQSSISLSARDSSGWNIKWTPSTGLSSTSSFNVTASPSSTTTYTAVVTDANGCSATAKKKIYVNSLNYSRIPQGDTTISLGQAIKLILTVDTSGVNYAWSPNYNISCLHCSSPSVSPTKNVTYQVEISNSCVDFMEDFNIKVVNDAYLEAPSAFTPNGDSNNDVFKFESKNIKDFDLKIFDRWGKVVFSTTDVAQGWDGKVDGHLQNIDTYVYYVKAVTNSGYKFEKKGTFLLLK